MRFPPLLRLVVPRFVRYIDAEPDPIVVSYEEHEKGELMCKTIRAFVYRTRENRREPRNAASRRNSTCLQAQRLEMCGPKAFSLQPDVMIATIYESGFMTNSTQTRFLQTGFREKPGEYGIMGLILLSAFCSLDFR